MSQFEFLTVALSFVLGLAITVLLSALITVFRNRGKTKISWLPLTWAAYILVTEFEVWWELYGLVATNSWSVWAFILLLLLALFLFAAGSLVLPSGGEPYPEDLGTYFNEDGKWGVGLIAAFQLTALVANISLFDVPPLGLMNLWNLVAIAMIVTLVAAKQRRLQIAVTTIYGIWVATYLITFVPVGY